MALSKKKCDAKQGDESTSKIIIIVIVIIIIIKDLEDKCLGTTPKIKSVICTVLS